VVVLLIKALLPRGFDLKQYLSKAQKYKNSAFVNVGTQLIQKFMVLPWKTANVVMARIRTWRFSLAYLSSPIYF